MIKFIPKDSKEILLYSEEQLEKAIGVKWLPQLEFLKNSFQKRVSRRCQKALRRDLFAIKQKWLGAFFSQEIQKGSHPDLIISWIGHTIGYGVIAGENLPKGAFVGEYTGVVRKRKRREENSYCFQYAIGDDWKTPFVIDAKEKGNYTRFINHTSKSNLEPISVYCAGAMHVILITLRQIAKGEQLCYDYGPDYWTKRNQTPLDLINP
ncbi:MAG TPA: SET domain-containing protein [Rhabdochlamydiaceae bacterium]|nr:SET domain-containing protein [Rhabdochlamydiaceae bacterium]